MTRVRDCTLTDLPFLIETAHRFNRRHFDIPLHPLKLQQFLTNMIVSPAGVCLRTDHGGIVGVLTPDHLRDWTSLVELAWYSEGRDGLRLLAEFERRGREMGADEIRMTTLTEFQAPEMIMRRRGYTEIERSHRLLT